jgi:hypothetical protein
MSAHTATSESGSIAIDRPHPPPTASWTIDPADSSVTLAWRKLRLWTVTGRLHCLGVVHLDDLPPVGVIRFEQPSGLPVLSMALAPANVEAHDAYLVAMLRSPAAFDALRDRWWTLRSDSLEILPTGTWRVMTGWCYEDTGNWIDAGSGLVVRSQPSALKSGSTWPCGPGEWGSPHPHSESRASLRSRPPGIDREGSS